MINKIGKGFSFPFRFSAGRIKQTFVSTDGSQTDEEDKKVVKDAISMIINTPKGARFMTPEFGSLVNMLPFEVADDFFGNVAASVATDDISEQETRADIVRASSLLQPPYVFVTLDFRLRQNGQVDSLVFPYYTVPNEVAP